jgi:methylmalonyl-CoA mutase N-terminal domain/subunit
MIMTVHFSRSKIPLKPVYTPEDAGGTGYGARAELPGAYPYTRGRTEGSGRGWIQRELSGEGGPKKSNEQLKYLITKGQQGVDVIGDSPTMGYLDADHPLAANSVGTQGVSLCCFEDYRELFDGIALDSISVSMSLPPPIAVAGLYLVAKERGIPANELRGSVIQWPFYAEDCGYAVNMPLALRLRLAADCVEFCTLEMPRFHSFLEDTYFFSEAGLNAVEEMALGFIEIRHLVHVLLSRGMDIDSFAPRIAILVNCSMDFFEEIAKIRAARKIFATMMKEEFGAKDPRSCSVVITCHTSGLSLTAQQPFNNIVRGAIQSLAIVLAGVHALEISTFDEAYRTPSPESHLVGLRTQQVIHLESGVTKVADPLGGSYYLESLTDEMERHILDMIRDIEAKGHPEKLSDQGWFKQFFEDAMARYAREIKECVEWKVGLNCHRISDEEDTLLKEVAESKIEPSWDRIDRIKELKDGRDQAAVTVALTELYNTAKNSEDNLMHPVIQSMANGGTMEEIGGMMRMAYGHPYDPFGMTRCPVEDIQ